MRNVHLRIPLVLLMIFGLTSAGVRADDPGPVNFGREVLPIFAERCFTCHGPDEKARKAGLRLDTRAGALRLEDPVIVPGSPRESELIARITSHDPETVMPPTRAGQPLTPNQAALLGRWIEQGAQWGGHWAFEPLPRLEEVPPRSDQSRNPIDRFVLSRLGNERLAPSPEADKAHLIRRVSLDLNGLPPTVPEVDAFLEDDRPDAYERLVDRLLASPRYGERMAMDWLDAARYADTNGYQNDFARSMSPWRDWVIDAFNRNQPFDRFLIEQVAGDLLPNPSRSQKVATGFERNNRTVTEGGSIDEEWRVENAVDRVETTATVFLGLTIGCARCHDHKFDPISQRDFYRVFAFFNSINEKGVYNEQRGNVPPLIALSTPADEERLRRSDDAIARAEGALKALAADVPLESRKSAVDELARLKKERAEAERAIPTVMILEELPQPRSTFVLKRGQYDQPDPAQAVEPGLPASLPSLAADAPRNRLGLALWMASPKNPLTARVAVNRIWQHHFGTGLVKTAENFGLQGERPTHPELLDWLSLEFLRSGWDVKALHRRIVTSATYRQTSKADPALIAADPENRLLARGPRYRLPAEVVRDNALAVSGLLAERLGGPSVKPYQPAGLWEELAGGAGEGLYVQAQGADLYRRTLYTYRKRTVPHPALSTFDAPSREVCQVKRSKTNTPLQALELLNDVTYVEAARRLAQRMILEGGSTPDQRITYAFRLALAREPSNREREIVARGLDRYRIAFADRLEAERFLGHGQSERTVGLDPTELAAYASTASVILNLDETISLE